MKITQLKPNPNNPRLIKDDKFKKLVKSLQEFPEMMEKRPMVCVTDDDGKIYPLGGNMRLRALQELKYKEIPDTWVQMADDWTEEQRREFTIKDNVGFGEWDWDELANAWDADQLNEWGVNTPYLEPIKNDDDFEQRFNSINDQNCLYPIVPVFDEDQELFIIVCENEIDANWLREKLQMQKMQSYKRAELSKSNIISVEDLKDVL